MLRFFQSNCVGLLFCKKYFVFFLHIVFLNTLFVLSVFSSSFNWTEKRNKVNLGFLAAFKAFLGEVNACDGGRDDNSAPPELMCSPSGGHGRSRSSSDFCGQFQNSRR